jgi:DnaJ like chaperone protein
MGWFSKTQEEERKPENVSGFALSDHEQLQKAIFVSTFSMIAKMAGADGAVTKNEVQAVDRFMSNVLKLNEQRRTFAIRVFNAARSSPKTFEDFARQYKRQLKDKPEMYEWMVDVLLRISLADAVFSDAEERILTKACEIFDVDLERCRQLVQKRAGSAVNAHYKAIGCEPSASDEEIERIHSTLSAKYDPDNILAMGLPEEFVEVARAKRDAIERAYKAILAERRPRITQE